MRLEVLGPLLFMGPYLEVIILGVVVNDSCALRVPLKAGPTKVTGGLPSLVFTPSG